MPNKKWKAWQEEHERARDLDFLLGLRTASREELAMLRRRYQSSSAPQWKLLAIARAERRLR